LPDAKDGELPSRDVEMEDQEKDKDDEDDNEKETKPLKGKAELKEEDELPPEEEEEDEEDEEMDKAAKPMKAKAEEEEEEPEEGAHMSMAAVPLQHVPGDDGKIKTRSQTKARVPSASSRREFPEIHVPHTTKIKPSKHNSQVFAAPMRDVDESIRAGAEALLHHFWCGDTAAKCCISRLLEIQLKGMSLRSGRKTSRVDVSATGANVEKFLVWHESEDEVKTITTSGTRGRPTEIKFKRLVGALVLQWKRPTRRRDRNLGGAVIEYVAASRAAGGQGWPLVQAAQGLCKELGLRVLYSAADMSQDGSYADGPICPIKGIADRSALAAHQRWGFNESSKEEWKALGLTMYDDKRCTVHYMKKTLGPGSV